MRRLEADYRGFHKPPVPSLAFQDDTALMGPQQNALLDAIKRSGGRDVRTNVIYGRVKAEGYGKVDQLVNAARARGLHVQMTLMGTPSYSPQWDQTISATRNDPRAWQQFAGEVAQHFKGRVGRYSIGNEPNWPAFIAGADKDPRSAGRVYRGMYRGGYAGIKGADRSAQVLMGELSSAPNAKEFLKSVLGGKPLKTAGFAYHPYENGGSWDINSLGDLQSTLRRYARSGKLRTAQGRAAPLYLTEFGAQAGTVSDQARAQRIARAYRLAGAAGARQLLSYQVLPTERRTTTTPGDAITDAYGGLQGFGPNRVASDPGWVWDTHMDPAMLARAIRSGAVAARSARARAARKR